MIAGSVSPFLEWSLLKCCRCMCNTMALRLFVNRNGSSKSPPDMRIGIHCSEIGFGANVMLQNQAMLACLTRLHTLFGCRAAPPFTPWQAQVVGFPHLIILECRLLELAWIFIRFSLSIKAIGVPVSIQIPFLTHKSYGWYLKDTEKFKQLDSSGDKRRQQHFFFGFGLLYIIALP